MYTVPEKISSVRKEGADKLVLSVGVADYVFVKTLNTDNLIVAIEDVIKTNQAGHKKVASLDDLKKLKELMDAGVISESDYNTKKKEILDQ